MAIGVRLMLSNERLVWWKSPSSDCWVLLGSSPCADFYINVSVHRESNLITVQKVATYSVYYISVGSSTGFGCLHPSSGAGTAVIAASGTGQLGLLPSALVVELELNRMLSSNSTSG